MKVSMIPAPLGLAMVGAAALLSAGVAGRAEGAVFPSAPVEGLVTAATDAGANGPATLTLHSALMGSSDTVLTLDPSTHFRKAGGDVDTPDELPGGAALQGAKPPSVTWLVGLYARASFGPNSNVPAFIYVSRPEPALVSGVVDTVSPTDLVLDIPNRGKLDLTFDAQTVFRLDGLPSSSDKFQHGDLVSALFWQTASENEALRVNGRTPPPPPPLHFQGVLGALVTDDGGAVTGFPVTRGNTTMDFTDGTNTTFSLNGKPATAADLKQGDYVNVVYQTGGSGNQALTVNASTPKPELPKPQPPTPTGGDHHGTNTGPSGGSSGGDNGGNGDPKPNTGGTTPKLPVRPQVFEGVVGTVDGTGKTFTVGHGSTTQSFSVDAKTQFSKNDKPAGFGDLQGGEEVHVIYRVTTGGNLALYVLIHATTGPATPGGGGAQP